MSTYEAMFDLHQRLGSRLKLAVTRVDVFDASVRRIVEAADFGIAVVNSSVLHSMMICVRHMRALVGMIEASMSEGLSQLGALERDRVRVDLAAAMDEDEVEEKLRAQILGYLKELQEELQEGFSMIELLETELEKMKIPRLVVG